MRILAVEGTKICYNIIEGTNRNKSIVEQNYYFINVDVKVTCMIYHITSIMYVSLNLNIKIQLNKNISS